MAGDKTPLIFGGHTAVQAIDLGTPALADVDFYIESTTAAASVFSGSDLTNSALADSEPPRDVTLTVTEDTAEDTVTSIIVVGKDDKGRHLREVIDASTWDDAVVFETDAVFRSVESVELVGWVVGTSADSFTVGFGDKLGLGVKLASKSDVLFGLVDRAIDAVTDSEVTVDEDDVNLNTVDLSGATYNGSKEARAIVTA